MAKTTEILKHEQNDCLHKEVTCQIGKCFQKGTVNSVIRHCKTAHNHDKIHNVNAIDIGVRIDKPDNSENFVFINAFGHIFMLYTISRASKLFNIMWIMGTRSQAQEFTWKGMTTSDRIKPGIEFNGPVLSYDENKEYVIWRNLGFEACKCILSPFRYQHTDGSFVVDMKFEIQQNMH